MKPTNIFNTIMFCFGMLLLSVPSVDAQNCKCPEVAFTVQSEPATVLTIIGENDYPYFLNVRSLKKYSNIKYHGLNSNFTDVGFYTLKAKGKNVKLNATYGKDGNLINGRLIKKDSTIPLTIRTYLADENYVGWTMTSNKTFVNDFNAQKTEYEVKIQQGKMMKTLFFDHTGKRIKKLSRT